MLIGFIWHKAILRDCIVWLIAISKSLSFGQEQVYSCLALATLHCQMAMSLLNYDLQGLFYSFNGTTVFFAIYKTRWRGKICRRKRIFYILITDTAIRLFHPHHPCKLTHHNYRDYYRDSREGRKGAYPPLAHGARLPFFGCLSLFAPPDQINMLNTPA